MTGKQGFKQKPEKTSDSRTLIPACLPEAASPLQSRLRGVPTQRKDSMRTRACFLRRSRNNISAFNTNKPTVCESWITLQEVHPEICLGFCRRVGSGSIKITEKPRPPEPEKLSHCWVQLSATALESGCQRQKHSERFGDVGFASELILEKSSFHSVPCSWFGALPGLHSPVIPLKLFPLISLP